MYCIDAYWQISRHLGGDINTLGLWWKRIRKASQMNADNESENKLYLSCRLHKQPTSTHEGNDKLK